MTGKTARRSVVEADELRQEATSALKRGYRWIAGVQWLYRLAALVYVVVTLFAILALARPEVPERAGVLVVALTTLVAGLMVMGAIHILFDPFLWTAVVASLASLVTVVHLVGPNPLGLAFPASAALALLLWAAVLPTLRFRELVAQHKDAYILHHASLQTRRALKGRTAEERHERLLGAMRRASRRAWASATVAVVALGLASTLGTYLVLSTARRPELSGAIEGFEAAWNAGDLADVEAFFAPEVRAQEAARLAGSTEELGWTDAPPLLTDGRTREAGRGDAGRVWIDYELDAQTVSASWVRDGAGWSLERVELPTPPLEPAVERFLTAWRTSKPEAVAAFFSPERRTELEASIEEAASVRQWLAFPDVVGTRTSTGSEGESVVTLALEDGQVTTRWHLAADGRWTLFGLRFPPR